MNAIALATKGIICGGGNSYIPPTTTDMTYGRPPNIDNNEPKISIRVSNIEIEDKVEDISNIQINIKNIIF